MKIVAFSLIYIRISAELHPNGGASGLQRTETTGKRSRMLEVPAEIQFPPGLHLQHNHKG